MRSHGIVCWCVLSIALAMASAVHAAEIAPPGALNATSRPNANVSVEWTVSPDDNPEQQPKLVMGYRLKRQTGQGQFARIAEPEAGSRSFTDTTTVSGQTYVYRLTAVGPEGAESAPIESKPVLAALQLFNAKKTWFALILVALCATVVGFILAASMGRRLWIRPIAALQAVDEAVGRSTEMGRPCLFIAGIQDINDIQTVAGLTILSRVAKTAAEYQAEVEVPTSRSLVMTAARESMSAAYAAAGRPEDYNESAVYYLTDEQFAYVAGVTGSMLRQKPAACFYMGAFYAESLFLAETGNMIGAIQIAGTAEPAQIPFFVAACDYVLIGEEFFAASAYLSGEPHQLGSLKGQDVGKFAAAALIIIGCALATWQSVSPFSPMPAKAVQFLKETLLK